MKKIILLSGVLYVLASFPASAQVVIQFPHDHGWNRQQSDYQYWEQIRMNREAEEHAREDARKNSEHDHGNRYAYGKDQKHHKDGWKDRPKRHGKSHGKSCPHDLSKNHGKAECNHNDR